MRSQKIKKLIQKGDFETISIGVSSKEMYRLLDGCFISSNFVSITLFDENFNQLKKIDVPGSVYGCAVHYKKGIYVTDYTKCCIYMMDNQLNMIKTFGKKGSSMNQLEYPTSICCQDDYVYVCDSCNKRIQIFTLDLKYHDTIQLVFRPCFIAVSCTTIAICVESKKGIHFYDIKTKELKKKYSDIDGRISVIDSYFYVISGMRILYVFDNEGDLIDETSVEKLKDFIRGNGEWDGFMLSTEDYLLFLSYYNENVLKFKF